MLLLLLLLLPIFNASCSWQAFTAALCLESSSLSEHSSCLPVKQLFARKAALACAFNNLRPENK